MEFKVFTLLALTLLIGLGSSYVTADECPSPQLMKPCECYVGHIACMNTSITSMQLANIFANLTKTLAKDKKHFKVFHMSEEMVINELKENTFQDIVFDEIEIMFNPKLSKIDPSAFNGTNLVTNRVSFAFNYAFSDLSIYDILSKFQNASIMRIYDNNITTIPTNAFKDHAKLANLVIGGNKMVKIEDRAFENLHGLLSVDIFNTSISHIPEMAFSFAKPNNRTDDSRIYFGFPDNILLTGVSFADNCFSHCDKQIELGLNSLSEDWKMNKVTFLKENVFRPFLMRNDRNRLTVYRLPIDCNDCRNYWLTKQPILQKHIAALQCSTGKDFMHIDNFKNCTT